MDRRARLCLVSRPTRAPVDLLDAQIMRSRPSSCDFEGKPLSLARVRSGEPRRDSVELQASEAITLASRFAQDVVFCWKYESMRGSPSHNTSRVMCSQIAGWCVWLITTMKCRCGFGGALRPADLGWWGFVSDARAGAGRSGRCSEWVAASARPTERGA